MAPDSEKHASLQLEGDQIFVPNRLDENFDQQHLAQLFIDFQKQSSDPVFLNMGRVQSINSAGIVLLRHGLEIAEVSVVIREVPVILVEYLTVEPTILPKSMPIESFYAPFCPFGSDIPQPILLRIGRDVPLLYNYDGFLIERDGFEPDFDPEDYFFFLTQRLA